MTSREQQVENKPWRVQWHIAPDGTVIRQRSKGDAEHQQLFQRHATTRRLGLADVETLDRRLAQVQQRFRVTAWPALLLAVVCLGGLLLLGVLYLFGIDTPGWLVVVCIVGIVVSFVLQGVAMERNIAWHQKAWRECGFASHNGETMSGGQARSMIADPGTVSGPETRVKRA